MQYPPIQLVNLISILQTSLLTVYQSIENSPYTSTMLLRLGSINFAHILPHPPVSPSLS